MPFLHYIGLRAVATVMVLVALGTIALVGCGDDGGPTTGGPAVVGDGEAFGGRFAELPLHPRSDPIGERSEQSSTVTMRSKAFNWARVRLPLPRATRSMHTFGGRSERASRAGLDPDVRGGGRHLDPRT